MASKRLRDKDCDPLHCPIEVALEVIGGMWKVIVVRELLTATKRYSELHRGLRHATHKMLAQQLRQLEHDGIVDRKVYPQVPPKVEYSLTPLGRELGPLLDSMSAWGRQVLDGRTGRVGRSKAVATLSAARAGRTRPAMPALRAGRR